VIEIGIKIGLEIATAIAEISRETGIAIKSARKNPNPAIKTNPGPSLVRRTSPSRAIEESPNLSPVAVAKKSPNRNLATEIKIRLRKRNATTSQSPEIAKKTAAKARVEVEAEVVEKTRTKRIQRRRMPKLETAPRAPMVTKVMRSLSQNL
jgi:hypothetical protein